MAAINSAASPRWRRINEAGLSRDITSDVIEFITREVHFLVNKRERHARCTSLFGLSMQMKGQENAKLSCLYDRIGARAVKTRAANRYLTLRTPLKLRHCPTTGKSPI
jgi:hypothetical protein